ncbi:unnamed protein product [Paramecium primaurelia]|uniref:Protein kinase domain-containing protein n=1 Tax=Paramecium primaurelia TaxID=5886 RepID=A0A8S1KWD2_PARPR|nr:unnamed protein product [Paramecium primaurelia]
MRPRLYQQDKKIINYSFDSNQYGFPQTTKNRENQKSMFQPEFSIHESSSPRRRPYNRVSYKITPSNNFSTQISQISKKLTQPKSNLTDKSGSSIEIQKDMEIIQDSKLQTSQKQHFHTQNYQLKLETKSKEIQTDLNDFQKNDSIERVQESKVLKCIQYPSFYSIYGKRKKATSRDQHSLQKVYSYILDESGSPKNSKPLDWSKIKVPLKNNECLIEFGNYLTQFEKQEILTYKDIYYIGYSAKKQNNQMTQFNEGFDNEKGEYIINLNDHIAYRFEVLEIIGKGSFGQALKVFDHQKNVISCLKIIRNKKKFYNQSLIEIQILTYIKDKDPENLTNIIKIKDYFVFRNHVCLNFELLSMNLYDLIKLNNFSGLQLELIRRFAIQILNSLSFLYKHNIIHCDLKPENILLKNANKSGIKIIDFGSSCFEDQKIYTYIQSRYYRAPEVILGIPYSKSIDMWSFGCILAELYLGFPLFPGENEQEQISFILELLGPPDQEMLQNAERRKLFFKDYHPYKPLIYQNKRGKVRIPGSKNLNSILRCNDNLFVDFLSKCLVWNPKKRIKPIDALMHVFILEGLPSQIRHQHIQYIENEYQTQIQKKNPLYQGEQGKQISMNFTSEPEMYHNPKLKSQVLNQKFSYIKQHSQEKESEKEIEKETQNVSKRLSLSFHSNKHSNYKQPFLFNLNPETTKNLIKKKIN